MAGCTPKRASTPVPGYETCSDQRFRFKYQGSRRALVAPRKLFPLVKGGLQCKQGPSTYLLPRYQGYISLSYVQRKVGIYMCFSELNIYTHLPLYMYVLVLPWQARHPGTDSAQTLGD